MHALLKSSNEMPITIERQLKFVEQVNPVLSHECRRRLRYMHMRSFDWEQGGLLSTVKFVERGCLIRRMTHESTCAPWYPQFTRMVQ